MSQILPEDILEATGMSEEELRQEIAVLLYQREKLTLARAGRLAGMNRLQFQHLLASRQIPIHFGEPDFEQDLRTLRELPFGEGGQ